MGVFAMKEITIKITNNSFYLVSRIHAFINEVEGNEGCSPDQLTTLSQLFERMIRCEYERTDIPPWI